MFNKSEEVKEILRVSPSSLRLLIDYDQTNSKQFVLLFFFSNFWKALNTESLK